MLVVTFLFFNESFGHIAFPYVFLLLLLILFACDRQFCRKLLLLLIFVYYSVYPRC